MLRSPILDFSTVRKGLNDVAFTTYATHALAAVETYVARAQQQLREGTADIFFDVASAHDILDVLCRTSNARDRRFQPGTDDND